MWRSYVTKIERGKTEDREQRAKQLAKQVAEANLAQVKGMVEADVEKLRANLPGQADAAAEHKLDMKYLRDRQLTLDFGIFNKGLEAKKAMWTVRTLTVHIVIFGLGVANLVPKKFFLNCIPVPLAQNVLYAPVSLLFAQGRVESMRRSSWPTMSSLFQ